MSRAMIQANIGIGRLGPWLADLSIDDHHISVEFMARRTTINALAEMAKTQKCYRFRVSCDDSDHAWYGSGFITDIGVTIADGDRSKTTLEIRPTTNIEFKATRGRSLAVR